MQVKNVDRKIRFCGGMNMLNEKALLEFVEPYYIEKDIMHNMWHIELVRKMVDCTGL